MTRLRSPSHLLSGVWFILFGQPELGPTSEFVERRASGLVFFASQGGNLTRLLQLPYFLVATLSLCTLAQTPNPAQPTTPEPKNSMEWFQRASDQMTLRMSGSAPFHMKVTFHAFPGQEMLGAKEKSDFVTGDGVYEETWLDVHQWRREVTLADYHAIEVEGNGVRKMQASSDYEPSRVLKLLEMLQSPISRTLTSREFHAGTGWKIDHVSAGNLALVRLSKSAGSQRADYTDSFYFMPHGLLAMANSAGLVTSWADYVAFGGKAFPKSLAIKAGDRDLLTANISIEPAGQPDPSIFDLPGGAAEPGMTLRLLHENEVRLPDHSGTYSWISGSMGPAPVYSLEGVLDRHGRFREFEVILAPNPKDVEIFMNMVRNDHFQPAKIDGSPCEFAMRWRTM